ncbi:hypothetical protein Pst134EB_020427 [Puccinia striiformis f. sp. tritici]|nr:hypothetical protein Pst134EB_020427 [Puccinia striiformis f. sp. tritici]
MNEYFKLARWEPEWIAESIRLAREMWEHQYKPPAQQTTKSKSRPKPQTGVLAGLSGASQARTGNMATDPLTVWLTGGLNLDDEGQPVNPLKWWIKQGRAGNTHGGLLQMALDVLSCPATTVDVERSFNFGRDYVSVRRHRLSASSLTQGMTVALYSKNENLLVPGYIPGYLTNVNTGEYPPTVPGYPQISTRVPAQLGAGAGAGMQFESDFRVVPAPAMGTRVPSAIPRRTPRNTVQGPQCGELLSKYGHHNNRQQVVSLPEWPVQLADEQSRPTIVVVEGKHIPP